jgi:hypothetical protein
MAAHAVCHDAPHLEFFAFEEIPGWVARVFRFEYHLAPIPCQAFAKWLAVHSSDDDVPRLRLDGTINDDQVTWVNTRSDHTVSFNPDEIDMRGSHVEQLVQRDTFFEVISSWRREASRNMEGKERKLCSAWF